MCFWDLFESKLRKGKARESMDQSYSLERNFSGKKDLANFVRAIKDLYVPTIREWNYSIEINYPSPRNLSILDERGEGERRGRRRVVNNPLLVTLILWISLFAQPPRRDGSEPRGNARARSMRGGGGG